MATKTGLPTTREEVLQLLIDRKTPRAFNDKDKACSYLRSFNGGCAIGQCVTKAQAIKMEGSLSQPVSAIKRNGTLPKRLANLDGDYFLNIVQSIHDNRVNWIDADTAELGEDGLVWNLKGKKLINGVIRKFNLQINTL